MSPKTMREIPLTCVWVWKNPNGYIADGKAFISKSEAVSEYRNCNGHPVRFIAPGGKEFKEKARRWAIQAIKK